MSGPDKVRLLLVIAAWLLPFVVVAYAIWSNDDPDRRH